MYLIGFVLLFAFAFVFIDRIFLIGNIGIEMGLAALIFVIVYCLIQSISSYKDFHLDDDIVGELSELIRKHGNKLRHMYIDESYLYYYDKYNNRLPLVCYRDFMVNERTNGSQSIAYGINKLLGFKYSMREHYDEIYVKDEGKYLDVYQGMFLDLSDNPQIVKDKRVTRYRNNLYLYTTVMVMLVVLFNYIVIFCN